MLRLVIQLCPPLCDPWTVATRLLCPRGFSRQEHWSGLPCPPPGDLPKTGIKPGSPASQVDGSFTSEPLKLKCLLKRGSVRARSWRKPQVRWVLRTQLWPRGPGLLLLFGARAFPSGLPCGVPRTHLTSCLTSFPHRPTNVPPHY